MIYVYAISEPPVTRSALKQRGLGGATLRTLERGDLAAIYSHHRSLSPAPLRKLVLHHDRVIKSIMATGTVLPLRFGTQLEHEEQLGDLLAARHDELRRSLERVRGKSELGVRVIPAHASAPRRRGETKGRDYLLERVRSHRRHQQAVDDVHAVLGALSEASSVRETGTAEAVLVAAYLVDESRVGEFRLQAERLAGRLPGTRMIVTGPLPPYSFAEQQR